MYECNVCIVVLVGIPASGKTTFCQRLSALNGFNLHIVCYDELCKDHLSNSRKLVFQSTKKLIQSLIVNKTENHIVVIDDNMYYKSMRSEYLNLCKQTNTGFLQVLFDIPLNLCITRNSLRKTDRVPESIILKMYEKLEQPMDNYFVVSSANIDNDVIVNFNRHCIEAINNPQQFTIKRERESLPLSELQKVDLVLRQIVSNKIQTDRNKAQEYNGVKQLIFKRVKCGDIQLPSSNDHLHAYLLKYFNIE